MGIGKNNQTYNINGDTAAGAIAKKVLENKIGKKFKKRSQIKKKCKFKKLFLNYEKLNTVLSKIFLCLLLMCY